MIIAQGKTAEVAALGNAHPVPTLPFFRVCRAPRGARQTREKGRVGMGRALPRAAASAALPWATIVLPLRGAGRANRVAARIR